MNITDPNVQSALIAAIVTIITLVLRAFAKPLWERSFHRFKLESEYKYDQRKKVRDAISKHKVPLLNAAEYLNHRLLNFSKNADKGWHTKGCDENYVDKYYLLSFSYRFLLFFAICRKVDLELVFLDSSESTKKDLEMLKYLKFFPQFFCDAGIFNGRGYDQSKATDHFFGDDFRELVNKLSLGGDDKLISFSEFKDGRYKEDFESIVNYFSGISVDHSCNRWHALSGFHFALISFLNDYGYDFQKVSNYNLSDLANSLPKNLLLDNIKNFSIRVSLGKNKNIRKAISAMSAVD